MAVFDNLNFTHSSGLAPEITQYYDRTLLETARANLVHMRDLQKRTLPKNNGKTVQFRRFSPFKAITEPLKEGVTPSGQSLSVSEIHATIKPYGAHVELTDEVDLTTIDNIHKETARLLAQQAEESLETIAADALNTGLNVIYADADGGVNTSRSDIVANTDKLTETHIKKAVRALEKAHARRFSDGYFHAIIDPDTKYDLTNCTMWQDIAKYQDSSKAEKYELGKMLGVKFYETTMTKTFEATQYLYTDAGVGVGNLALSGGSWDVSEKTGYFTVAKTTAYAAGTAADYAHWCRRMAGQMVRVYDAFQLNGTTFSVTGYSGNSSSTNVTNGAAGAYMLTVSETIDATTSAALVGKTIELYDTSGTTSYTATVNGVYTTGKNIYLTAAPGFTPASGDVVKLGSEKYFDALIDQAFVEGANLKCTLRYMDTTVDWAYVSGDKVYAQSGGASSSTVHSTLVYGEDYAGCVELGGSGANIHAIVKPCGSSGAVDPLDQRGTVAWKVEGFCVTPLQDAYCVRIEHAVSA